MIKSSRVVKDVANGDVNKTVYESTYFIEINLIIKLDVASIIVE